LNGGGGPKGLGGGVVKSVAVASSID